MMPNHHHFNGAPVSASAAVLGTSRRWLRRTAPASLLGRVRWLFLLFGLIVVGTTLVAITQIETPGGSGHATGVASVVVWTGWLFYRYRHPTAPALTDLVAPAALLVMGVSLNSPGLVFAPAFVLLFFRAMYGTRAEALVNGLLYFAALHGSVAVLQGPATLLGVDAVTDLIAFVTVAMVMQSLGAVAARHEVATARERTLTQVSSRLLAARSPNDVYVVAAEGALDLLDDRQANASVWIGTDVLELAASVGSDLLDLRQAPLQAAPEPLLARFMAGRPYILNANDTRALEDAYSHPHRFEQVLVGPLLYDQQIIGALIIASPNAIDPHLLDFVERFANEISLATDRAKLVTDLREANLRLQRADELKDRFLSTLSHELRTPLTSIRGFARTLRHQDDRLTPEQRSHFLDIIERQTQRQERLVEDLLTTSRIASGHLRVEPRPVSLNTAIAKVLEELEAIHEVHVTGSHDTQVVVDPDHLHQVLVNLITNARKYGAAPFVLDVHNDDGDRCTFSFTDQGEGIPDAFLPHLFEPFTQAGTIDADQPASGVGLGLSIVRSLLRANRGDIVHDPNRPGAYFEITLANRVDTDHERHPDRDQPPPRETVAVG